MSGLHSVQQLAQKKISEVPLLGGFLVYTSYPGLKADSKVGAPKPNLTLAPEVTDTEVLAMHSADFDEILAEIPNVIEEVLPSEVLRALAEVETQETSLPPVSEAEAQVDPAPSFSADPAKLRPTPRTEATVEERSLPETRHRAAEDGVRLTAKPTPASDPSPGASANDISPQDLEDFLRSEEPLVGPKLRKVKAPSRAIQLAAKTAEETPVKRSFLQRVFNHLFVPLPDVGPQSGARKQFFAPSDTERSFFFRALDDRRLYKLGDSFYRDFKAGKRSFGFGHVNSGDAQKRSILGVASFIKYFDDLKILVVTDKMEGTFFAPFKTQGRSLAAPSLARVDLRSEVTDAYGVHYLELHRLIEDHKVDSGKRVPAMIKSIMEDYDLVLVDLPPEKERKDQYNVYLPFLQALDHVTLSISLRESRFSEIQEMKDYFASYKIPIKGTVIDRRLEGVYS